LKKINNSILFIFLIVHFTYSQEWKSLKQFKKETGNSKLCEGCWLTKDRKNNTSIWIFANQYNLKSNNGSKKYISISQKRDFYLWFDKEIKSKHHEIKWIGIAYVAANQLSKVDIKLIRFFIVRNDEVVRFLNNGSNEVFDFSFPHLKEVYYSKKIIKGLDAKKWDRKYGLEEQCQVLDPLYKNLSAKAIKKLEKMAKGKGLFSIAVSKEIEYEGELMDCNLRYEHGVNKLLPYYLGAL